ncbi:MAG TPA: elongation factor G [Candidatus Borkfalkia excrementigallinarum]|uniref:Elongation factor G n=1 Tax=Candidatus Borkfalkia excrementigallinarum TaxID=2838506 RepID=A0A9D2CT46_9FIRM|nr:elongation factor G [Candidatus Borkfalkia excrementigallinarum]
MSIKGADIRNIAVIGHSGEGKTSVVEALLFNGGMTDRLGKVTDGNTVTDYDEQEIARKMSISLSMAYTMWDGVKLNLLDVPGFYDFEGEENEALRAAGGALIVTGATGTLTVGAEKAIDKCLKNKIPMVVFINGVDKDNADYAGTVAALKEKYAGKIAPIQIPLMEGNKMVGYINALKETCYHFADEAKKQPVPIPEELKGTLAEMQANLTETAAENDEALLDKYFEEGSLSKDEIIHGIRKGIYNVNTIPVMAGSALQNRGIINLMDEIVKYMPSAEERQEMLATAVDSGDLTGVTCEPDAPFAAQVFKTVVDPFVGKLNVLKVFRGTLKSGSTVYNATTGKTERINQIYLLKGKKQEPVSELSAGDIGAVNKLAATNTGDTLCDEGTKIKFDPIHFPRPVLSMAIYAEKKGDEDKIFQGLNKLAEEDYTFSVAKNAETGEMLISGQGETHLDVINRKLKAKFNVSALLKTPKIAYRETIRKTVEAEGKHKKQSGGHGQYGHCKVRFEPFDGEFEFAEEVVGGSVPKQYIPAVEKGLIECLPHGVLAGYPVTGLRAVLYDGSYHDVDSSEMAFKLAAAIAFKEGLKNAKPVLLEPVMRLKIAIPESYLGDIMGDMNKRRGRILGIDMLEDMQVVNAEAPQAELQKYATDLRSMTQGRGKFMSELARYEEVPPAESEKIVKARAEEKDA